MSSFKCMRKMEKTILPEDYEPSSISIICGRGKGSYQSDGNVHFRALIKSNLERYKEAPGRLEKSFVVSEVLNMIRESCPVGAFVKYENGRWYDLDDSVCREKVGSLFRDNLHETYKSSSKNKRDRKRAPLSTEQQNPSPETSPGKIAKTSCNSNGAVGVGLDGSISHSNPDQPTKIPNQDQHPQQQRIELPEQEIPKHGHRTQQQKQQQEEQPYQRQQYLPRTILKTPVENEEQQKQPNQQARTDSESSTNYYRHSTTVIENDDDPLSKKFYDIDDLSLNKVA